MPIDRNLRRRLFLYGGAILLAAAVMAAPRIVTRMFSAPKVASWDLDAAMADEGSRLLAEYLRIDTSNPPGRTVEAVAFWRLQTSPFSKPSGNRTSS